MNSGLLTVLIVDDELPIRQELRLYPWEKSGVELIGEARNGDEALHFCRDFAPNIVITDITMPVMDGLELCRALRRECPETQIILLTCHSDFAYAKEAVQLGAVDYLVKVAMEDRDLSRALDKAKEAINRGYFVRQSAAEERRWELSKRLVRLVKGAATQTVTAESAKPDNVTGGDGLSGTTEGADGAGSFGAAGSAVASGTLGTAGENGAADAGGDVEQLLRVLRLELPVCLAALHITAQKAHRLPIRREAEAWLTRLERTGDIHIWLPAADDAYLLFFDRDSQRHAARLRPRLETMLRSLCAYMDREWSFLSDAYRLYAVISEPLQTGEELAAGYEFVTAEHGYSFYDAAGRIFLVRTSATDGTDDRALGEMNAWIRKNKWDRERLIAWLQDDFPKWANRHRPEPDLLKGMTAEWRGIWFGEARERAAWADAARSAASAATLAELIATLVREAAAESGKSRKLRKEIVDAKQYIEEHLGQAIALPVVAAHVGLSPHYVSRLFREEVGVPFNDYVTKLRVEKAADLLQSTNMRVYEVAMAVGIPSYRYFTSIFREWTGVAPTAYKKG
jgi:two-component system response regulator YesN